MSQIGQTIIGYAAVDKRGKSVSLSSDGRIVAIGSPYVRMFKLFFHKTGSKTEKMNMEISVM